MPIHNLFQCFSNVFVAIISTDSLQLFNNYVINLVVYILYITANSPGKSTICLTYSNHNIQLLYYVNADVSKHL